MVALLVAAQVVALVAMLAVSLWGWKHLEPETRIRARGGTSGIDWTMSKNTALVLTPGIGFLVVAATALGDPSNREPVAALGLPVMIVFLLAHWSSVTRAAR